MCVCVKICHPHSNFYKVSVLYRDLNSKYIKSIYTYTHMCRKHVLISAVYVKKCFPNLCTTVSLHSLENLSLVCWCIQLSSKHRIDPKITFLKSFWSLLGHRFAPLGWAPYNIHGQTAFKKWLLKESFTTWSRLYLKVHHTTVSPHVITFVCNVMTSLP